MINYFHPETIAFEIFGYPMSYVELIGTVTGLLAVAFAARSNILTWPIGLVNVICFFFIFFHVQLYSDMFLQIYYFVMCIYGWIVWKKVTDSEHSQRWMKTKHQLVLPVVIIASTLILGFIISQLHLWFPSVLRKPAALPYLDTLVACMSIIATFLQARKLIECWVLWIITDVICTILYWVKDIKLVSMQYFIFTLIAIYALWYWIRLRKDASLQDK